MAHIHYSLPTRQGSGSATLRKRHFSFSAQVKPSKYAQKFKSGEAEESE